MKYLFPILFLIIPIFLQAQFEGKIVVKTFNQSINENAEMVWHLKNNHTMINVDSRTEKQKNNYKTIFKQGENYFSVLGNTGIEKKAYIFKNSMMQKKTINLPLNSVFQKTEEIKKINGWECRLYKIASSDTVVECWVSEDTGVMPSDYTDILIKNDPLMALLQFHSIKGIPVQYNVKNIAGELKESFSIQSISSENISDDTFEIPSDYQIMRM